MKTLKTASILLIFMLAMAGCVEKPIFLDVTDIRPIAVLDSIFQVSVEMIVFNTNKVNSHLTQSNMGVYFKNEKVGTGTIEKEIKLHSKDTVHVPVMLHINLTKLSKFFPELIESDSVEFAISGENQIKVFWKTFHIQLNDKIVLNTRKVIKTELDRYFNEAKELGVKSIGLDIKPGFSTTKMNAIVVYRNTIPFDYSLKTMELSFFLNNSNKKVASWSLSQPIHQQKYSETEIPVEIELENFNLLSQMSLNMMFTQKVNVSIRGIARIEINGNEFEVPVETETVVSFKDLANLN